MSLRGIANSTITNNTLDVADNSGLLDSGLLDSGLLGEIIVLIFVSIIICCITKAIMCNGACDGKR